MKSFLFLAVAGLASNASNPSDDGRIEPSRSKADWIGHIETMLPVYMCRSTSELRACYAISAQECEESMASAARVCAKNIDDRIPDPVSQEVGTKIGDDIGDCAINAFAVLHEREQRNDTPKCKAAISAAQAAAAPDDSLVDSKPVASKRSPSVAACKAARNHTGGVGYPPGSLATNEQGKVLVKVRVGKSGRVDEVGLVVSSGYARLDEWALAGAHGWTFDPEACAGLWFLLPVTFSVPSK